MGGAVSTRYYFDNERRLFTDHGRQGAHAYGVDISEPTVRQAGTAFDAESGPLRAALGDVRHLPFQDASVGAVYSMGTIEHFDETERGVGEIARVLEPGGRAIVGVPNRYDPFLRPLLAALLQAIGMYGYGYEKSYSRLALKRMLGQAGLVVVAETAILFIPGWLRMLDLACHSWCRPFAVVTGGFVRPFMFLDRYVPALRRHGYLAFNTAPRAADRTNPPARSHRTTSGTKRTK